VTYRERGPEKKDLAIVVLHCVSDNRIAILPFPRNVTRFELADLFFSKGCRPRAPSGSQLSAFRYAFCALSSGLLFKARLQFNPDKTAGATSARLKRTDVLLDFGCELISKLLTPNRLCYSEKPRTDRPSVRLLQASGPRLGPFAS
jgi:hypothetical protein